MIVGDQEDRAHTIWHAIEEQYGGGRFAEDGQYCAACREAGDRILALPSPNLSLAMIAYMEAEDADGVRQATQACEAQQNLYDAFVGYAWLKDRGNAVRVALADSPSDPERLLSRLVPEDLLDRYHARFHEFCASRGLPMGLSFSVVHLWTAAYTLVRNYDLGIGVAKGGLAGAFSFSLFGLPVGIVESHRHGQGATFQWCGEDYSGRIASRSVILFDKDVVTGRTLTRVARELVPFGPSQLDLYVNWDPIQPGTCAIGSLLDRVPPAIRGRYYPKRLDLSQFLNALEEAERRL